MSNLFYPRLSDLLSVPQLPTQLGESLNSVSFLDNIRYTNLTIERSSSYSLTVQIDIVLQDEARFALPGDAANEGFILVINPNPVPGAPSIIPLTLSYTLRIKQFVPDFDLLDSLITSLATATISAAAIEEFYARMVAVAQVDERDLLRDAITFFEADNDDSAPPTQFDTFATKVNQQYGLAVSGLNPDPEQALTQLLAALATANLAVSDVVFTLYITASDNNIALQKLYALFGERIGPDPVQLIRDLATPDITAAVHLAIGLEIPRNLLLPVEEVQRNGGTVYVPVAAPAKAQLLFNAGDFLFSTQGGFGYEGEVTASLSPYPRVQIGNTGLQVAFSGLKLDLSERYNLAEADADSRPGNFRGIYAETASVFLPENWKIQAGAAAPVITGSRLLIGTGGLSGTITATGTGAGPVIQAQLFSDVDINFTRFSVIFSRNEVVASDVTGTFVLKSQYRAGSTTAHPEFAFTLLFSADGYRVAFGSTTSPVAVRLGSFGEVRFTSLAFSYLSNNWYIDIAAEVLLNESLPIVGKVLPKQINIQRLLLSTDSSKTALSVQPIWPDGTSVSGDLDTGLVITRTLNLIILDAIKVDLMRLAIARNQTTHTVSALATFDAALKLGNDSEFSTQPGSGQKPRGFLLQVQNIGFYVETEFKPEGGDIGPAELDVRFKLPDGVLVSVNAGGIVGGGSLAILENGNRYEGSIGLTFQDKINLGAFVILLKNLPNGQEGPSLLALISVSFQSNPIQLGLGFKLEGVGGLIGLHRTASIPVLRAGVSNGSLANLLFPANPAQDAAMILRTMDQAFPAAANRYTFGLMGKIGWGTPTLVTLDIGLIIEVPAPVRFILLGVLQAMLPNASSPIIRLRADFLGVIDFGAKKISFDAQLVNSRVLQFALNGSFAFRLYQGDDPVFLMTAGGFHPAFHPPANADLPTLRRLELALAQGSDFRLTLTSYLAITSNTVQFGSRLDLYVGLPSSFYITGFLAFDALFRFNPFYLEVRIGAGVAIKRGSRSLLSISLNLLVSGPAPWHIDGEGSFKILFFRIRFRVNRTFGGGASQPALPTTDVRQLLAAALQDKGSWEVQQPEIKPANTVVLRTDGDPSELVVDPGGALAVRQKVVPFDFPVEVYGNTRATNGSRFDVASVTLGDSTAGNAEALSGASLGEIREAFAPSQFRRMSDGEKLSAPAFQSLRSGLRLNTVDGLKGHGGQTRQLAFEKSIISPASGGQQRAAPGTNALVAGGGTGSSISTSLSGANLHRLAQMGAVSKTRRSYEQRRPSRKAPDQVLWDEDSYVIVSVRNLEPDDSAPNPFSTEAEATAYLKGRIAADPAVAGELQVIPVYQLDVSTSANAANLATA